MRRLLSSGNDDKSFVSFHIRCTCMSVWNNIMVEMSLARIALQMPSWLKYDEIKLKSLDQTSTPHVLCVVPHTHFCVQGSSGISMYIHGGTNVNNHYCTCTRNVGLSKMSTNLFLWAVMFSVCQNSENRFHGNWCISQVFSGIWPEMNPGLTFPKWYDFSGVSGPSASTWYASSDSLVASWPLADFS